MDKTLHSQCGGRGPDSIPGQGTRSPMLQLKIPHVATKTLHSQTENFVKKNLL